MSLRKLLSWLRGFSLTAGEWRLLMAMGTGLMLTVPAAALLLAILCGGGGDPLSPLLKMTAF